MDCKQTNYLFFLHVCFCFSQLRVINLGHCSITSIDQDWGEIVDLCPQLQVLELNDNLLQEWGPLLKLFTGWANRLLRIDLSRNPLSPPTNEEVNLYANTFIRMEEVILGGLRYGWEHFKSLATMWPMINLLTVKIINKVHICIDNLMLDT